MGKIMFASSLDHMSGGDAWHCLLHLHPLSTRHKRILFQEKPLRLFRYNPEWSPLIGVGDNGVGFLTSSVKVKVIFSEDWQITLEIVPQA